MSSIFTSILKFTIGILFKKLRDKAARHLTGEPTDEAFRQLISRELNEIKSKLDALIRKDLLSSVEFLEDGICHLQACSTRDISGVETSEDALKSDFGDSFSLDSIALVTRTGIVEKTQKERFKKAQECFKIAGQEATRAFSNPGLNIEDRILATKLRITARILEGVNDLECAVNAAVMYLQSLHELAAVQEAFSVYLDASMKSIFNKTERLNIIQNVTVMNLGLFRFTRLYTRLPRDLFSWPSIELVGRTYQPVLRDERISLREYNVYEVGPFQFQYGNGCTEICEVAHTAVDSKGNILAETSEGTLSVINTVTDESEVFYSFCKQDTRILHCRIDSVAIDNDDNVYVITCTRSTDKMSFIYKLWVFGSSGDIKRDCILDFLPGSHIVGITAQVVASDKLIFITKSEDEHLYVCDNNGKLKSSFPLTERFRRVFLSHADTGDILVGQRQTVCVYNEKGNLRTTIQLSDEHRMYGLAFNNSTKRIIVLTKTSDCMQLLSFGEGNDMRNLLLNFDIWSCRLTSHLNGLVALIGKNGGLFV